MQSRFAPAVTMILVLALGLASPATAQQTRYFVTRVKSPFSILYGNTFAINENGQMAGFEWMTTPYDKTAQIACLWSPDGTPFPLPTLRENDPEAVATGHAINNLGHVAGTGNSDNGIEAFLWTPETGIVLLGDLPIGGFHSEARGMNDLGQVVGHSSQRAFIWDAAGGMKYIGDFPGGQEFSIGYDINNLGQVVGDSIGTSGNEAFIWDEQDGMRKLAGAFPVPGKAVAALAINDRSQVTGVAYAETGIRAFFWDPVDGFTLISLLPGSLPNEGLIIGRDINDHGQVVGETRVNYEYWTGFIWDRENGPRDLSPMLAAGTPPAQKQVRQPRGINNHGQIACNAGGPALLTPFLVGDMNCDGVVDKRDIAPLRLLLESEEKYRTQFGDCPGFWAADLNQDGVNDWQDYAKLIQVAHAAR